TQRAVASGQHLQHLPANRREPLSARRAQLFGMRQGVSGAAPMIVIRCGKDGGHGSVVVAAATHFKSRWRGTMFHEKRSHAAWRETPSASPIAAQLTSRLRSVSTASCSPVLDCSSSPSWNLSQRRSRSVDIDRISPIVGGGGGSCFNS